MNAFRKHHLQPWGLALVEKYPEIFLNNEPMRLDCKIDVADFVSLRYGFEHGEGWSKLVDDLAKVGTALVTYLRSTGHSDASIHGCICKEKFGTLRWQGDCNLPSPFNDLWHAYVCDIEHKSSSTCEMTGKYGELCRKPSAGGWVKTLCKEEAEKLGYETIDRDH